MIPFILLLSQLAAPTVVHADEPLLNYLELEAIAKASINAEVADLNQIAADYTSADGSDAPVDYRGYRRRDLKLFKKFDKPEGFDADVFYGVCFLTKETITAITARKFTKQNLQVTANIKAVDSLRGQVNNKFFRLAEHACLNAKYRFIARLATVTQKGTAIGFTDEAIQHIADVVFFPTVYSRPTVGKTALKLVPIVVNGFFVVSRITSFAGVAIDSLWMSICALTGSTLALKGLLPGPNEIFKQRNALELDSKKGLELDLTAEETELKAKAL